MLILNIERSLGFTMLTPQQIEARRKYMELLIRKAKEKALSAPDALLFDPQGRVLIDVELTQEDKELFRIGFPREKTFTASKFTTVSLDVTSVPVTEPQFIDYQKQSKLSDEDFKKLLGILTEPGFSDLSLEEQNVKLAGIKEIYMNLHPVSENKNKEQIEEEFDSLLYDLTEEEDFEEYPKIFDEYLFQKKQGILQQKYREQYQINGLSPDDQAQLSKFQSSIIPLQQELHFHLALASRTYAKVFESKFVDKQTEERLTKFAEIEKQYDTESQERQLRKDIKKQEKAKVVDFLKLKEIQKLTDEITEKKKTKDQLKGEYLIDAKSKLVQEQSKRQEQMALAHQNAMRRLQPLIQQQFIDAVAEAKKGGTLDTVILNEELDKARKRISIQAHNILMEEVVRATGERLTRKDLKKADVKHLAEATTATNNDLLHVDGALQQATWISGSDNTAHERGISTLADRQIATISLDSDYVPSRLQIRTPSLDVKEDISKKDAINDISVKLTALATKYDLKNVIRGKEGLAKAFTYNLHTAINDTLGDTNGNKQSEGARIILSGAHLYNKTQMLKIKHGAKRGEVIIPEAKYAPNPLCLVQNISVNGNGDELGYGGNSLRTEATLMTEMAMLYNLSGEPATGRAKEVFQLYRKFLMDPKTPSYPNDDLFFSNSEEGKQAIKIIGQIKEAWMNDAKYPKESPVEQAQTALKRMMANDLHHQHKYAKLIQSLSIFIEEASIAGCKSGNERAQAINGRVAIFDHEAAHPPSEIFDLVKQLASSPLDVSEHAEQLIEKLDSKYDQYLQSGASLVSDVDQGASAKVNVRKEVDPNMTWYKKPFAAIGNFFSNLNRNNAESPLPHLKQGKAGNMQAHKGLTKEMADSWEPKSFGKFLGKIDIFLSVVTLSGWLIKRHEDYKDYKAKATQEIQERYTNGKTGFDASAEKQEVVPPSVIADEVQEVVVEEQQKAIVDEHVVSGREKEEIPNWRTKRESGTFVIPPPVQGNTNELTLIAKKELQDGRPLDELSTTDALTETSSYSPKNTVNT